MLDLRSTLTTTQSSKSPRSYIILNLLRYGRITLLGGESPPNNVDAYLCFHLKLRASHLMVAPYSDYQEFLYQTISKHLEMGWNYQQSADWLNENGYTTPRGKKFRNAHTHSIVKKKKIREVRITKLYEPELTDFQLRFVDKTILNQ